MRMPRKRKLDGHLETKISRENARKKELVIARSIVSTIVTGLSPDGGREGGKDQGQPRPAIPAMRLHPPASPARLRLLRLALLPADLAANLLRVCAVQCTKASADEIVSGKQHQACRARLEGCAEERSCTCARHGF